jgi:hypothetical protein
LKLVNQKIKIVAYEIDRYTWWEPGIPDPSSPNYSKAMADSYRRHCKREVGTSDADLIEPDIDYGGFTYHLRDESAPDIPIAEFNMNEPIHFCASLTLLEYLDFPDSNPSWPIMSRQMLETLEKVGEFRHHTYSTVMEDNEVHRAYSGVDMDTTGLRMHDFLIVQPLDFLDPYDWENSEYTIEREIDWKGKERVTADFTKIVLKEPLPPFFRLKGHTRALYVSAAAKEALQASDTARGVYFSPIDEEYRMKLHPDYPIPKEYLK